MHLKDVFLQSLDELSQKMGEKIFSSGEVLLDFVQRDFIRAHYPGPEIIQTTLRVESKAIEEFSIDCPLEEIRVYCTCQKFLLYKSCEHLFALALRAKETSFCEGLSFVRFTALEQEVSPNLSPFVQDKGQRSSLLDTSRDIEVFKKIAQNLRSTSQWRDRPRDQFVWYVLDPYKNRGYAELYFYERRKLKDGSWGKPKKISLSDLKVDALLSESEKRVFSLLRGALMDSNEKLVNHKGFQYAIVQKELAATIFNALHPTGRLGVIGESNVFELEILPLTWSSHKEIKEHLFLEEDCEAQVYRLMQSFYLGENEIKKESLIFFFDSQLALWGQELVSLNLCFSSDLSYELFKKSGLTVEKDKQRDIVGLIRDLGGRAKISLPQDFPLKEKIVAPNGILEVDPVKQNDHFVIFGKILFDYEGEIHEYHEQKELIQNDDFFIKYKNLKIEEDKKNKILRIPGVSEHGFSTIIIHEERFEDVFNHLTRLGFQIRAFGKNVKSGSFHYPKVKGQKDWFDLDIKVSFDQLEFSPPDILRRLEGSRYFIKLNQNEVGLIPSEWLSRIKTLSQLAPSRSGIMKFPFAQALVIREMFKKDFISDKNFDSQLERLTQFDRLSIIRPSKQFQGKLRGYQTIGLSWMHFLEKIGCGGCLADEMGLGKTIQVISYIQKRKMKQMGTFLVVVPKSLVTNWQREAKKFTPNLVVRVYEGGERERLLESSKNGVIDILLITYGLLRRDIEKIQKVHFDGIVLDEAQNIKNSKSQTAKSAYKLKSTIKLALTGTPVENHLGELFSIFRFLMPGLFKAHLSSFGPTFQDETLSYVLKGLRPFLLRRNKEDVLKELPLKTESVVYCEFSEEEKKEYQKLAAFYRTQFDKKLKDESVKSSSFHALEGLLRLRQFSCHPKLLDEHSSFVSAKIPILLEHLREIRDTGKKTLVFSQFTSFLKLIALELDKEAIGYCYLDGKTSKREQVIDEFGQNAEKTAFLISLKAGGVGLNLTCANYCYILDPWWNPAVENQAIDRIHRIGQKDPVFIYRLISKDTVEQKVVELQETKKGIEKLVFSDEQSFLGSLSQTELLSLMQ